MITNTIQRFKALFTVAILLGGIVCAQNKPNILYIMADDHASATIGAYNSYLKDYVQTPNIDRLATEGALLENCFCTNALCAPSRATILTGQYSHKSGMYTLREHVSTQEKPSIPKALKQADYQTAVVGKWHIHGDNLNGFDYYAVTLSQGAYYNPSFSTKEGKIRREGYSSDIIGDVSLEWLGKRDKTKPFFLMTHFKAAHGPWQPAKRHESMYADETIPEPTTLFDDYTNRSAEGIANTQSRIHNPGSNSSLSLWFQKGKKGKGGWPTGNITFPEEASEEEIKKATYQKYVKDYLRCVKGIDENVGRLIEYLEKEGELDNTIIVYTSDQGMYIGEHGLFDKRIGFEEALRMPFVIRYPDEIKAGQRIDNIVNNVDFAETFIDYAGVKIPNQMQGYSFRAILKGEKPLYDRKCSFYAFYSNGCPKHYGIRTKEYKLLYYASQKGSKLGVDLFDLTKDPNEMINQANNPEYKTVLEEMNSLLKEEMKEIDITQSFLPGNEDWKLYVNTGDKLSEKKTKANKKTKKLKKQ
ncbi:sulfatase [Labilibacter sediminis]|nr:sulfatase [Labilibacter sediminis]